MANEKELKAKIEKRKPGRKHEIGGVGKKTLKNKSYGERPKHTFFDVESP